MNLKSPSQDRSELARRIMAQSRIDGDFTLRSGLQSSYYLDKYRFESDPSLLVPIVAKLQGLLPATFDKLAGMELGGIPLATVLSIRTGKSCLFVRKSPKTYGTCKLVEGGFDSGDKVVVIEDVITTAGQVCASIEQLRDLGLEVDRVLCVVDREQGGRESLGSIRCELLSVFTIRDLEASARTSQL